MKNKYVACGVLCCSCWKYISFILQINNYLVTLVSKCTRICQVGPQIPKRPSDCYCVYFHIDCSDVPQEVCAISLVL